MLHLILFLILLPTMLLSAQETISFKDGVYVDFNEVMQNKPLSFNRIVNSNPDNPKEILEKESIEYINEYGVKSTLNRTNIWGYVDKGTFYILINKEFHRLTMLGTISHLFVNEKHVQSSHYDPYYYGYGYNMYSPTYESNRLVQYIIDFKTGTILPMELSSVESLLSADSELYIEFMSLKKRKRKQLLLMYIRRFNENNPLPLPVSK